MAKHARAAKGITHPSVRSVLEFSQQEWGVLAGIYFSYFRPATYSDRVQRVELHATAWVMAVPPVLLLWVPAVLGELDAAVFYGHALRSQQLGLVPGDAARHSDGAVGS